jgi:hypothetical protein
MPTKSLYKPGSQRLSFFDNVLSPLHQNNLWADCPLLEAVHDPALLHILNEDFHSYNAAATTGDYVLTQATSGSAAIHTTKPGMLLLDAGATTQHQGANLQRLKSLWLPAAGKDLWAEFLVILTAATKAQIFVGLAASDTTILPSGANSTNNRIGWSILTTELLTAKFDVDKAGTNTRVTGKTFTSGTLTRLGFKYDGTLDTLQQYVDGVAVGDPIATTYIPKAAMYPSFVCQSDGTDQPTLGVSYRIAQLR